MRRFRNLPLFWKLLLPFLALMVIVGAFGVFIMVRDLAGRAQTGLEQDVARRSLDAHSVLRDRELFLIESSNLASNLEGMAEAVRGRDDLRAARLLQSVVALKSGLDVVAVADASGQGLAEFVSQGEGPPTLGGRTNWAAEHFAAQVMSDPAGVKRAGLFQVGGQPHLVVVAPVCSGTEQCQPVGLAITGIEVGELVRAAAGKQDVEGAGDPTGVSLFDSQGRLVGAAGSAPSATHRVRPGIARDVTRTSDEIVTMYSPYEVQGSRIGTLATSIPTTKALTAVRGAALSLSLIVILAMIGVVVLGSMLSRAILRQVTSLLETNRSIGRGDLSARAPVESDDELGELAQGVNQMAEQLQASYETLELRVAQRTEEVQRLLKERTEFFASLSHELRTPLAVILGEVKLMKHRSTRGASWVPVATERLGQSAEQLLSLVNEVLELASTETGKLEMRIAECDVGELISDLRPTIEGLARTAQVEVDVQLPKDLPKVKADAARLRDIIVNLVDNAVKYTPKGGHVELGAVSRNGKVIFRVSDTGVGVPEESIPLVFDPFYRVPGVATQRGQAASGLGLALTKRLVEAQGGEISVESTPGEGSEFTFTVPRAGKG